MREFRKNPKQLLLAYIPLAERVRQNNVELINDDDFVCIALTLLG